MARDGMHDPVPRQGENSLPAIRIREDASGLSVAAILLEDRAPANAAFLWDFFAMARKIPAIHAMWTGPEISAPIPDAELTEAQRAAGLPLENATVMPQPGDVVLTFLPPRVWGGGPAPVFDIGLFYGPGARLLFPIGWQPGSVAARISDVSGLAAACGRIRQSGACVLVFEREPSAERDGRL
jgi:hypothetical protein